jgi:hypothetical protein
LREYRAACSRVVEHAVSRLQQVCALAVEALVQNLEHERGAVRNVAAKAIIETALRAVEMYSVLAELESVKAQLEELRSRPQS